MSLIEYTLDGKIDKVQVAVNRITSFDPITNGWSDDPYYVAYSGGKDSDALRILFSLANVKHELWHNHTTVDAPETVYYIRSIPGINIDYPELTMWKLIVKKRMPPTRMVRYCCRYFKEHGGNGRFVSTGVRWDESNKRRKNRGSVEIMKSSKSTSIIINADNDESRRTFESCLTQGKQILNPIIDWSDEDVWELLNHYSCKSNPLYQCGFKRVGCVGCPMAGSKGMKEEFIRYPKYAANYIRAFDKMLAARIEDGYITNRWKTGEDIFNWWIGDEPEAEDEEQMSLFLKEEL